MQTRVKDYARVLNVWFVFFPPIFFTPFDPYSGYSGILRRAQTYSGIITHIQELLRYIQAYQNPAES